VAGPLRQHPVERLAGAGEIADEVGVDHVAPGVLVHLVDRLRAERGAAHEHVDPAEPAVDFGEYAPDLLAPRRVGGHSLDLAAAPARIRERIVELGLVPAERQHPRAFRGERGDRLAPDAGGAAGHQNALARQAGEAGHVR
jgi:hypothetical protein